MYMLIALFMAVAPALLLLRYFLRQDSLRPEPRRLIIKVFIWGVLSTFGAVILETAVSFLAPFLPQNPLILSAFEAFLVAGLCEELIKYYVVRRTVYRDPAFDEVMDGIIYTIVASLGFACWENILYVMDGGLTVALTRAFTAIPLHAFCSGLMGYYIGKSRFSTTEADRRKNIRKGLFIAVLIHGTYDFLLFAQPTIGSKPLFALIPLLAGSGWLLKKKIAAALEEDARMGRHDDRFRWYQFLRRNQENNNKESL